MTAEQIEAWLAENKARLLRKYGVPHWRVAFNVEPIPVDGNDVISGSCWAKDEYERATITICSIYFRTHDEQELEDTVSHEIKHLLHACFADYRDAVLSTVHADHRGTLDSVWDKCCERFVRNMDRAEYGIEEHLRTQLGGAGERLVDGGGSDFDGKGCLE